jgi:hypothetical protein
MEELITKVLECVRVWVGSTKFFSQKNYLLAQENFHNPLTAMCSHGGKEAMLIMKLRTHKLHFFIR